MKKLLVAALVASSTLVAPGATPLAWAGPQDVCKGHFPEAWRRPGGYCDQLKGGSVIEQGEPGCSPVAMLWLPRIPGARIDVAYASDPCDPCYAYLVMLNLKTLPVGDRVQVAGC